MNIVICENDKNDLDFINSKLIKILDELNVKYNIKTYNSGESLIKSYNKNTDIILMDIQMSGINGMETAKKIRMIDDKVEIIFITSFLEYAVEGYEVRAYRYLLKPVKYESLKVSITNCLKDLRISNKNIIIKEGDVRIKLNLKDIIYIDVQRNDITIHLLNETYTIKGTMNNFEKEIDNEVFFRCHKSYLINMDYIKSIKRYSALLLNNEEIPISRYKYKEIKDKFFDLIEDKLC